MSQEYDTLARRYVRKLRRNRSKPNSVVFSELRALNGFNLTKVRLGQNTFFAIEEEIKIATAGWLIQQMRQQPNPIVLSFLERYISVRPCDEAEQLRLYGLGFEEIMGWYRKCGVNHPVIEEYGKVYLL